MYSTVEKLFNLREMGKRTHVDIFTAAGDEAMLGDVGVLLHESQCGGQVRRE
jgi:hypothetical protein